MMQAKEYQVRPLQQHRLEVEVPGSKSITNRALLLAAMGDGPCTLHGVLFSEDSRAFLRCLQQLGFLLHIDEPEKRVTIQGTGGSIPNRTATIHVGSAGTAARFLTVFLAFAGGDYHLQASEQMCKRPMEPLITALRRAGAMIHCTGEENHFPFELHSRGMDPQSIAINTDVSSQFASALMMAGCLLPSGLEIKLEGQRTNGSYIKITQRMLEQFGIPYVREGNLCRIPGGCHHHIDSYEIEPDVSAAAYFYAMAPICGRSVSVKGVHLDSMQGDIRFLKVLEQLGCSLTDEESGIRLEGTEGGHYPGITINMKDFSDQTMTMAVVAAFADTPTTIEGIGHIRFQESNRLQAIITELRRVGIQAEELQKGDAVRIYPGTVQGALIETYEDHRMAMAFSLLGLRCPGIRIHNPGCCAKAFEHYFDVLDTLTVCPLFEETN